MRKKLLGLFAALSMILTGVGASLTVAPAQAEAQSYRHHRGSYGNRYHGPRRGYRGYRGGYYGRGYRGDRRSYYRRNGYRGHRGYRSYGRPHYRNRYYARRYRY